MWYRWVTQQKVLTVPPGSPPLIHVFLPGVVFCGVSTGDLPEPQWIDIPLALNGMLMSVLLVVLVRTGCLWRYLPANSPP